LPPWNRHYEPPIDPANDAIYERAGAAMLPTRLLRPENLVGPNATGSKAASAKPFFGQNVVIVRDHVLHARGSKGLEASGAAILLPMQLAYSMWLARAAATAPAACANFSLCWMEGDGIQHQHQPCFSSSANVKSQPIWYNFQVMQQLMSDLRDEEQRIAPDDDYDARVRKMHGINTSKPFSGRQLRAVWRGSLSNPPHAVPARVQLVNISLRSPELLDARWSHLRRPLGNRKPEQRAGIPEANLARVDPILPARYYADFQIVVVANGLAAAFRTAAHLTSGQVVVLARGGRAACAYIHKCDARTDRREWREWFYELLEPWEDYVPVDLDVEGELEASLRRLYAEPKLRARISERAKAFWARHFGDLYEVGRRLACELAARQRGADFSKLIRDAAVSSVVLPTGGKYGGHTIDFSDASVTVR
jgi:hypothetical protein